MIGEKIMADCMKKNYKVSGSGVLNIDGDAIIVCCEDRGEFNLAKVLADLDGCAVKFNFSHDEDYETDIEVDEVTGEVI
jgi:hypothetical protein